MRTSFLAGLAFATGTYAQFYANQSAPFTLVLQSSNTTLNGSNLNACHEGAAIEGLCVGSASPPSSYNTYNFNYTAQQTPDPKLGYSGLIVWELRGGNFNVSSGLELQIPPTSHVGVPLFFPGDANAFTNFGFDKNDKLFIFGYLDNSVSPPVYTTKAYYHWYACFTNAGYYYQTLAWSIGHPENPTCVKVDVKRVFV